MYDTSTDDDFAEQQVRLQRQLTADAWRYSEEFEELERRLARDPDDPKVAGQLRTSLGFYKLGREAARQLNRDVTGGNR